MTDDELREIVVALALSQTKIDTQLAKTDAQFAYSGPTLLPNPGESCHRFR